MARIRTVKPEMWTDGKVVRLSDAANLLFLALLNQADDLGRLKNDPKEIECRAPRFWERSKSLIAELESVGLVNIYGNEKEFLEVSNFLKHQVIDRPRPSEIPSPNSRRMIAERSPNSRRAIDARKGKERKGVEGKGKEYSASAQEFEILWNLYPRQLGKKIAYQHFEAAIQKDKDCAPRITKAINNYIAHIATNSIEEKFIKHGSTFFNQWEEWENYESREDTGNGAAPVPGKYAHLTNQPRATTEESIR